MSEIKDRISFVTIKIFARTELISAQSTDNYCFVTIKIFARTEQN